MQKREEYTILYIKYIWGDKMYFAIIGDIIKSRTSSNRYELQISLNQVLMELNEQYKNDMISDFTITLGDEFQGVLKNPRFLLRMLDMIELELYPTEFRFGIGIGDITTAINQKLSIGADGPAYYNARDMVDSLKKEEKRKKARTINRMIKTPECAHLNDGMINTVFSLMTVIRKRWSDRDYQIIWDYMSHEDFQVDTARRLNIAQSTVQKSLDRAGYYTYVQARETITDEIIKYWEQVK